ncbi:hypothetical protein B296_00057527 [Ensete ventricosum]|uniref:Uncharacterized protein n=1 Tax=Ensete ventricosum TaxID=4639 RepID=A0A426XQU9_ENSVE|nr:hypothetical protein B296_00057527 [Ensete ventricosum]
MRKRQGEDRNEEVAACEVLLIHGIVPRFSDSIRLPLHLPLTLSSSLLLLPLLLPISSHSQAATRLILPDSGRQWSRSKVTDLFRAITKHK